jgi:hypothetical protein
VSRARASRSGPTSIAPYSSSAARCVRVLPVQVHHVGRSLGERCHRRQPSVDVGPRTAVGGDDPGEHRLDAVRGDETPVDACLGRTVADDRGVGAATDQQLDRLDEHRLARPGLAGDCGQPRPEHEFDAFDHSEVLEVQFGEHREVGLRC